MLVKVPAFTEIGRLFFFFFFFDPDEIHEFENSAEFTWTKRHEQHIKPFYCIISRIGYTSVNMSGMTYSSRSAVGEGMFITSYNSDLTESPCRSA